MKCKEQRRLSDAYFDVFKRQQWITQRLVGVRQGGDKKAIRSRPAPSSRPAA
jgi:hypothetical protein